MTREDWIYVNLEKPLIVRVDKSVKNILWQGSQKYVDRKDFVVKAIQTLLDIESGKKKILDLEEEVAAE